MGGRNTNQFDIMKKLRTAFLLKARTMCSHNIHNVSGVSNKGERCSSQV